MVTPGYTRLRETGSSCYPASDVTLPTFVLSADPHVSGLRPYACLKIGLTVDRIRLLGTRPVSHQDAATPRSRA